jgi:sugar/nucleoside kinase (ribokinase family)
VARIAVIGSVAQDDVVWLLQPLHDGRHLDGHRRKLRLGGGGANTAIPLRHAGHDVALVAPVGADAVGEWLLAKIQSFGIDASSMTRVPGESTRSLVLLDADGERTIINLNRCRDSAAPERVRALEADVVYVRSRDLDLGPALAERTGGGLVVAHVPPLEAGARPAGVLVGSESDLPAEFLASPWESGRAIAGTTLRWVVVTRGERGASAFSSAERLDVPAPHVHVVDSTAAGDVFAAGLVHALAGGQPMPEALRVAAAWGAAAVACAGLPDAETICSLA